MHDTCNIPTENGNKEYGNLLMQRGAGEDVTLGAEFKLDRLATQHSRRLAL